MGLSKKHQVDGGSESDGKKWVLAGIMVCAPLRSITTKSKGKECDSDGEEDECSTTPTAKESKIPENFPCPPAPRKRRPSSTCHYSGVREFFTPPDLESIFVRHVERAN